MTKNLDEGALSPSQLSTFEGCPRRWGFAYIEKLRSPSTPQQAFGIELHEQLEGYLKWGIQLDLTKKSGQAALVMLPHLPSPGAARVEEWFYLKLGPHTIRGKKDVEQYTFAIPRVSDHKSTSDAIQWAKTREQLLGDIAFCVYGADAMVQANSQVAEMRWIYTNRNKPYKANPVDVLVTREELIPTLLRAERLADEIKAIPKGTRALQLPYNAGNCNAFHQECPYTNLCNLTAHEKWRSIVQQSLEADKQAFYQEVGQRMQQQGGFGMMTNPPMNGQQQFPMQQQPMGGPPGGFAQPPQQGQGGMPMQQPQPQFAQQPMQQPQPQQFAAPGGFAQPPQQGQGGMPMQQPQPQFAQQPMQQPQPMTVQGNPAVPGWAQAPMGQQPQQPQPSQPPVAEAPKRKRRTKAEMQAAALASAQVSAQVGEEDSEAGAYELLAEGYAMLSRVKAVKGA